MATKKVEFQGKDVAAAIRKACEALNSSQEELDIEVLHTGSAGIFGLCRRNARLRVSCKSDREPEPAPAPTPAKAARKKQAKTSTTAKPVQKTASPAPEAIAPPQAKGKIAVKTGPRDQGRPDAVGTDGNDAAATMRSELVRILELMGFPSEVTVSRDNNSMVAHITGDYVQEIVGPEGRTLDSLQYLLRKMISKKHSEKIMLSLDAGDFRANRLQELEKQALKLADEVKQTGKTRSLPSLNPSERRVVHLVLQDDKELRSRSVGDGLFKKVLIYKQGTAKKNGSRKRRGSKPQSVADKTPAAAE